MLTKCEECGGQVSDKAYACPHCGCPISESLPPAKKPRQTKRMRLPNGFGQISLIKNQNLRNPYRVMIPDGKTETGRPRSKLLKPKAYFKTYNEAYTALTEYWKDPRSRKDMTVRELYDLWVADHFKDKSKREKYNRADWPWRFCEATYNLNIREVRVYHIKECMEGTDEVTPTDSAKAQIKTMWNQMLDFAVENDYLDKNVARQMTYTPKGKNIPSEAHKAYSDNERSVLWENVYKSVYIDMTIIQFYSGWRPSEICALKTKNVDLIAWTFHGGMKTKAGIGRIVPIHTKIRELVSHYYAKAIENKSDTLFINPKRGTPIIYDNFYKNLRLELAELGMINSHVPHDGRKTFITLAKRESVNEFAIKRIVGHRISDITERVYTERPVSWLAEEIEKIRV